MPLPAVTDDELAHWLALRLIPGLGPRTSAKLIERYKSPLKIFRASVSELEAIGVSGSTARSIASGCTFDDAVDQQQKMLAAGAGFIPVTDPRYPKLLKPIYDPPMGLFFKGNLALTESVSVAVVGTRHPTPYGIAATERLAGDLAIAGIAVVSGMARGIDSTAHKAALAVGGETIAIFGCGVDLVYPTENRKLYLDIVEKGLMLSEFPMGSPAYPQNFPIRNRIISGMSSGVLIVEGAQYSGSTITARLALDHGREVFAVPGNITSKMSWAPNLLIKQGAKLIQDWNDVFNDLTPEDRRSLAVKKAGQAGGYARQETLPLTPQEGLNKAILDCLQVDTAIHIDDLMASLENYSSSELIAGLFDLEMQGMVKQLPGKNFVKVW
jgi:DNA processing protein